MANSASYPESEIASRVAGIMSQDSPLMRQATATGMKAANRRGLINSTMGIGATHNAVLGAATPIASQESSQAATERNVRSQIDANADLQAKSLASQAELQGKSLASNEAMNKATLAQGERERMLSGQVKMMETYSQSLARTLENDKIPAATRNDVQAALLRQYQDSMAFMQNLYGVTVPTVQPAQPVYDGAGGIGAGTAYPYNYRSLYG